ncbi:PAP2 superfamily protein [Pedobacter steynii]|uniref:PAP2 superfamily protein n=1 Tax=Pedobacter steynii TaxID=430522 RepID=A0A1G9NK81_9SPHI|nr:phosphatase PAP2 family protein [Pedobacter steynii]NQX39276.1 phosphatase PAP2 family protein [Pedobacter steynii]SDL86780.1 PAP2 superfamily protein [Pedobacter steynii]
MKNYFPYAVTVLLIIWTTTIFGQDVSPLSSNKTDTLAQHRKLSGQGFKNTIPLSATIIPTVALAYGFVKLNNNALTKLDEQAKREFYSEHPHRKFRLDDYLQFAPGAAVFALNGLGIKGKNSLADQSGVYLLSNIILNTTAQSLKRITDVTRPDGTSNAFPSGHAAEAFASAEFLRQEYGDVSVWYTVSGYSAAFAVGYLRMYNNKHWLSDVIAGAGLGVFSTQAAYWLYPKIKRIFSNKSKNNALILPSYSQGTFGLGLVKTF